MHTAPLLLAAAALGAAVSAGSAQQPAAPDSARVDTLPALEVRVTRAGEQLRRLPFAAQSLDAAEAGRARLSVGIDEMLTRIPGVVALNRWNYSLDQRLSLRGAGSRANFGIRGVKVLLDGVPQTLPDGQGQLTNLELGVVERVEALTGSAGALYGNASGGVLAFETETPRAPLAFRLRSVGGAFGTWKAQTVASARGGRLAGFVSGSWFGTDGFRQHSAAETRLFTGRADYLLSGSSTLGVSVSLAEAPKAENPGALTLAEYEARRDSAAANNINRGADKAVSQEQVAVRWRWAGGSGAEAGITAFGLHRDLVNPLATPPPSGTTGPDVGTWNAIGRYAGGIRLTAMLPVASGARPLRLGGGVDFQTMRDDRRNERSFSGEPSGEVLADQRETVRELGVFAQAHWEPAARVLLLGAVRGDFVRFRVADRYLGDGEDQSGARSFESLSGSLGASVAASPAATLYANLSTSFETPTTTELVNQASGAGGFNTDLGPQRTVTGELGLRSGGRRLDYSLAVYTGTVRDAIVQAREVSGRAFFANAGRLRVRGVEASVGVRPSGWLGLGGAYTFADHAFTEYRVQNGAVVDTLDGNRLPGVPRHYLRLTAAATLRRLTLELDQTSAGYLYADDPNLIRVDGWGAGVTAIRASARFPWGRAELTPFGAIENLFDRRYVGSVTVNGVFGRVLEPAAGRQAYVGIEIRWSQAAR